ncbi:MAG: cytochrome C oxidase subunit IV family protein [Acidobacteria bacterium]|nr:cytochrome C oxidase subunit IV family protein [Acidobacteriota bacterium]
MEAIKKHIHRIPYRTYIVVWLVLLALTAILVLASELFHEALAVWAMLVLTPIKAGLVFFFFMHLKYEKTTLKALVFMTLGLLVMVIALFFLDISYR